MSTSKSPKEKLEAVDKQHLDGVVVGLLIAINDQGEPLVVYPANPDETAIKAKTTKRLTTDDIGKEIALLFEGGNPQQPLIIGCIQHPVEALKPYQETIENEEKPETINADIDGEHMTLSAQQSITLKCGKASITLTKAGKILVRGRYILTRSSGVNRIKGGSVQIN